jgi:hypothetical protein
VRPSKLRIEDWDLKLRAFPFGHGSEQVDRHAFVEHEAEFGESEQELTKFLVQLFGADQAEVAELVRYPADRVPVLPPSSARLDALVTTAVRNAVRNGVRPATDLEVRLALVPVFTARVMMTVIRSRRFGSGTGVAAVVAGSATSWALGLPLCCRNEFRQIALLHQWVAEAEATGSPERLQLWLAARMKIALRRSLAPHA